MNSVLHARTFGKLECLPSLHASLLAMYSSTKDSRAINIHDNFFKRSTRSIRKRSSGNLRLR